MERISLENIKYLDFLPKIERDIFTYNVINNISQVEIAKIFNVTQGAISSRLARINKRICFLKKMEKFDLSNLEKDLSEIFDAVETEILKGMLETTCQTSTAVQVNELFNLQGNLKLNQVKVRHRFKAMLQKLKNIKSPHYELYALLDKNLYILHEVRLPHFDRRNT